MNYPVLTQNRSVTLETARKAVPKLSLIEDLLQAFHRLHINYCHWKSNEHLAASMTGNTDLDILFDKSQKEIVERLMTSYGFKLFTAIPQKQYQDICDFIGLDLPTGRIVHVHTHYKLTLGERYLKGYQFNIENKILDSSVYDKEFEIYRIAPAFELVLLFFRHALKIRTRDRLKFLFTRTSAYSRHVLAEYEWLKRRCTDREVEMVLKSWITDFAPVYNLVIKDFTPDVLIKLSKRLHQLFREQRLYSPFTATITRWYREIFIKILRRWSRLSNQPVISQRVHAKKGLVVSLVGADGSGKTTIIGNLQATFRKKIDVFDVYMGRGKSGTVSWQRKLLKKLKAVYSGSGKPQSTEIKNKKETLRKPGFKLTWFRCLEALSVARERQNKLEQIGRAKKKGMLVICDRYPQNQLMGYNDGPALSHLLQSNNRLLRKLARKEAAVYRLAEDSPPDLVFKLIAGADVMAGRKPGRSSLEDLELKVEGIRLLKFRDDCHVVTIDASQPLKDVIVSIKKEIWAMWA